LKGCEGGRRGRANLFVYHRHVDKALLILRADDVEEDLDRERAVAVGLRRRAVGGRRPASDPRRAFVCLAVRRDELGARRWGAASSLESLLLAGDDVDGQEENDG